MKKIGWNPWKWPRLIRIPIGVGLLLVLVWVLIWPPVRDNYVPGFTYCGWGDKPRMYINQNQHPLEIRKTRLHEGAHVASLQGDCFQRMVATLPKRERLRYEAIGFCAEMPVHLELRSTREGAIQEMTNDLMGYWIWRIPSLGRDTVEAAVRHACTPGR